MAHAEKQCHAIVYMSREKHKQVKVRATLRDQSITAYVNDAIDAFEQQEAEDHKEEEQRVG